MTIVPSNKKPVLVYNQETWMWEEVNARHHTIHLANVPFDSFDNKIQFNFNMLVMSSKELINSPKE